MNDKRAEDLHEDLSVERAAFEARRDELVRTAQGQWAVFVGEELLGMGTFEASRDGYKAGLDRVGPYKSFLLKQIFPEDPVAFIPSIFNTGNSWSVYIQQTPSPRASPRDLPHHPAQAAINAKLDAAEKLLRAALNLPADTPFPTGLGWHAVRCRVHDTVYLQGLQLPPPSARERMDEREAKLLRVLGIDTMSIANLAALTGYTPVQVRATLTRKPRSAFVRVRRGLYRARREDDIQKTL